MTYVWQDFPVPWVGLHELGEPLPRGRSLVFGAIVHDGVWGCQLWHEILEIRMLVKEVYPTLKVDARLRMLLRNITQMRPSRSLPLTNTAVFSAHSIQWQSVGDLDTSLRAIHSPVEDARQVIGPGPGGAVFDIVVAGHVLGGDGDLVRRVLGEEPCGGQAGDTCSGGS